MREAEAHTKDDGFIIEQDNRTGFIDLLVILLKRKKFLLQFALSGAIVSAAISMALPNIYHADAKILPPQQNRSAAAAMLAQLGGFAGAAADVAGIKNPNDLYIGMLKSRAVADRLIAKFNLKQSYATDSFEAARLQLASSSTFTSGKDGLITIDVESKDQKLVAQLTNAYISELQRLTSSLALTEASQRRVFFERQLELAKDNLAKVEQDLKGAIDSGGLINVDAETNSVTGTIVRLRAQISAKEIELNSMRAFVTPSNPSYLRAEEELKSLRTELARLETGKADQTKEGATVDASKQRGLQNVQLLRDLKYRQMLYELLAKQYEAARLDEAKDSAAIQILDAAIEPERKFKPKRSIIVIVATIFSLLAAVCWVLVDEMKARASADPAKNARIQELRKYLRFKSERTK